MNQRGLTLSCLYYNVRKKFKYKVKYLNINLEYNPYFVPQTDLKLEFTARKKLPGKKNKTIHKTHKNNILLVQALWGLLKAILKG